MILALETSCDDTCAAVLSSEGEILANVISSQGIHDRYGGVVPEIASRHHLELIDAAVADALRRARATLDDVELVADGSVPVLLRHMFERAHGVEAGVVVEDVDPAVPLDRPGDQI